MFERLYRSLYRIRRVEEEVARVYPTDLIKSPVHLSIGQEASAVGACWPLSATDVITFAGNAAHAQAGEICVSADAAVRRQAELFDQGAFYIGLDDVIAEGKTHPRARPDHRHVAHDRHAFAALRLGQQGHVVRPRIGQARTIGQAGTGDL